MFINQLERLCKSKGITVTAFIENELHMSKGNLGSWNKGGHPSIKMLGKIADYFNVSTDYLLTGKNPDSDHPENDVTFDDFTYAFLEESGPLSDRDKETLLDMARMMRKRQHEEGRDK